MNEKRLPTSLVTRAGVLSSAGFGVAKALIGAKGRALVSAPTERARLLDESHEIGARELVAALGQMRGIASKVGQMLAQTPGVLPAAYVEKLLTLNDQAPAMGYSLVKVQVERELGKPPDVLFEEFERRPFAAASIGQVHRAKLRSGESVAVKVQYPGVAETMESDLSVLRKMAGPLGRLLKLSNMHELLEEMREGLLAELDYRREAEQLRFFREAYATNAGIEIPAVVSDLSTSRVLTMGLVRGETFTEFMARNPNSEERNAFGMRLLEFTWKGELDVGRLHVDPNPGNFLWCANERLGVVDFGSVKIFSESFATHFATILHAVIEQDLPAADAALEQAGLVNSGSTERAWQAARRMVDLWGRPFRNDEFDFGQSGYLQELLTFNKQIVGEVELCLPREWLFLCRDFVGVTYICHRLALRGRLREAIDPYVARALQRSSSTR